MKDRQPTQVLSNGAIRYGFYNADGTLNHYEYLKRDDAPTEEGTPLNKANLLSDATAAKIWPNASTRPEDPTVSEALAELQKGTVKVGDILMTVRAKPSDAWLLCNGQAITRSAYPKLFELLRPAASPAPWTSKPVTGINQDTNIIRYANGKWFAFPYNQSGSKMHMYVSSDTDVWVDYPFSDTLGDSEHIADIAVCYNPLKGVYRMAIVKADSMSNYCVSYTISEDLQTVSKNNWIWSSGNNNIYKLELYASSSGNVYCFRSNSSSSDYISGVVYEDRITASSSGKWNDVNSSVDAISYDETSRQFCWTYRRNIYMAEELSRNASEYLIGTIPDAAVPSGIQGYAIWKYICASIGTIIAIYQNEGLKYAYTLDNGTTWHIGAEAISTGSTDYIYTQTQSGFEFVSGLLLFTVSIDGTRYICSVSDPEDKVYKISGIFDGALSPAALAAQPPKTGTISICNYNDLAKPVPTIIPDSGSHAYIKALEE